MIEPRGAEQAQIFGEDAVLYDRFRPSYPRDLMEAVVAESGELPVLEIGAGTGKATKALLALGKRVHALEPDRRMAAILETACAGGPVTVEYATLETADLRPSSFGLAVAAQSWHWVDREIAYDLVADTLTEGAGLALVWHHPRPDQGLLGEALKQLYTELAPTMPHLWPGVRASGFDPAAEPFAATKRFRTWSRIEHRWERHLDPAGLVGWLCSTSEHRLLPIDQRTQLMTGVAALAAELGPELAIDMTTIAHLAYRV